MSEEIGYSLNKDVISSFYQEERDWTKCTHEYFVERFLAKVDQDLDAAKQVVLKDVKDYIDSLQDKNVDTLLAMQEARENKTTPP